AASLDVSLPECIAHRLRVTFTISLSHTSTYFFFTDPSTPQIHTLSLHDALPIWISNTPVSAPPSSRTGRTVRLSTSRLKGISRRSEEHTSELQSHLNLVCRLLLEKKKKHTLHNRIKAWRRGGDSS